VSTYRSAPAGRLPASVGATVFGFGAWSVASAESTRTPFRSTRPAAEMDSMRARSRVRFFGAPPCCSARSSSRCTSSPATYARTPAWSSSRLIASLNSPTALSFSPNVARRKASIFDFESATTAQPFTSSLSVLLSPLRSSFAISALNLELLFGWVSPTTSLPPFLKSSQTTSTSGPSAGLTSRSKFRFPASTLALWSNCGAPGNLRKSPSAFRHCADLKSVLSEIRTAALAGTTSAAAGTAAPPPPPQPAAASARAASRKAAPARIALLDLEEGVEGEGVAGAFAPRHE
jgi:hypothetical protein